MRPLSILAPILLGAALAACSVTTDDDASQVAAHSEDQPTNASHAWLWANDTLKEFKAYANATAYWEKAEFLPIDHPMAQHLQFWVDQMDEALRARSPEALVNTPKPQVILRKQDRPNAWVSVMPVVWKVPSRLARAESAESAESDDGEFAPIFASPPLVLVNTGKIETQTIGNPVKRRVKKQDIADFLAFHNDGFATCKLSLDDGTIVFGSGCAVGSTVMTDESDNVGYYAMSRWLTITTGLLTNLDEDRVVAVLAHELGHYYRTHGSQPTDELNYFYSLGDANTAAKPTPDPRYLTETAVVRDKLRSLDPPDFSAENALMTEQRLGFYTIEQEADELSLELLARVGLPPSVGLDSQLQLHRMVEELNADSDVGDIGWSECSALRERDFKDEHGAPVSVPVGTLSDPHHSFCFRTFNMARELAAHSYQIASPRPTPPGKPFSTLLAEMQGDL